MHLSSSTWSDQAILMAHDASRLEYASHPSACISPHLELDEAAAGPEVVVKRASLLLATMTATLLSFMANIKIHLVVRRGHQYYC